MTLTENFTRLTQEIIDSKTACGSADEIKLIAVSKTQPASAIETLYHMGQLAFGESYLQEALVKINALQHLTIKWHFIGRLQSNKTKLIAQHFDWVQSLSRWDHAKRLDQARGQSSDSKLNVLIQVNIDNDINKEGVAPTQLPALCDAILTLPHLHLRGLMTILQRGQSPEPSFAKLSAIYQPYCQTLGWDTLSMGMSRDFAQAIQAGATMVRVGTRLFDARKMT